eukprot:1158309-Pelagomonas_calceolata.AAC.11
MQIHAATLQRWCTSQAFVSKSAPVFTLPFKTAAIHHAFPCSNPADEVHQPGMFASAAIVTSLTLLGSPEQAADQPGASAAQIALAAMCSDKVISKAGLDFRLMAGTSRTSGIIELLCWEEATGCFLNTCSSISPGV